VITKHAEYTRLTSPSMAELGETLEAQEAKEPAEQLSDEQNSVLFSSRSDDDGGTWSSVTIPGSVASDKPSLAIDTRADSPFRGHIYVAWFDVTNRRLAFSRSRDGGRTYDPALHIGGRNGYPRSQIAVGPAGTVHVLWSMGFVERAPDDPHAGVAMLYARSTDGGATFSNPVAAAQHGGSDLIGLPSMAVAPDGELLAAWSETRDPLERGVQARHTIRVARSADGTSWSPPRPLCDVSPEVSQGMTAVASTDHAWHVLSYDVGPHRSDVRVYSAPHGTSDFAAGQVLASRPFGIGELFIHGNYQLRRASDLANVGDYVGLAGCGSQLAAAIVLPAGDDWASTRTAFAGVLRADDGRA
jgi:hypothetical protein